MKRTILLTISALAFSSVSAQAQIFDGLVDGWVGEGSLTGSRTTGNTCLLYTSPSPRDQRGSRMPSSA